VLLGIHRDLIETFGGRPGVRDETLLGSAIEQARATFGGELLHPTVHDQAAAYLFHIVKNHPFVDGNKRVAFAAIDTFLTLNGIELEMSDDDVYDLVVRAADSELTKAEITVILRASSSSL
jgi:death-on-curing protein